ncbi:DUF2871 family protein [Kribbella jiaozuonensis]|uniref:DUF2871 family protein n=1 Tax=Kribbella jiaozuonensis TaxID=2575441 RepID=A0A4U3LR14_9ACTN|nr:DUF2871 family protein [Kribbella jiaozuonensis]TKK77584.1 DUF2871 family protein [Kribbella jiaozuonensis]
MLFFLIVLVLEKQFTLTAGTMTVFGRQAGAALDGVSGLGHIVITLGLIFFFVNLGKRLPAKEKAEAVRSS